MSHATDLTPITPASLAAELDQTVVDELAATVAGVQDLATEIGYTRLLAAVNPMPNEARIIAQQLLNHQAHARELAALLEGQTAAISALLQGTATDAIEAEHAVTVAERDTVRLQAKADSRRRWLWRLGTVVAAGALYVGMFGGDMAHAAVIPVTPRSITLTVAGPTARIDLDVVSTAPETFDGGHGVLLTDGRLQVWGTGAGGNEGGAALVHVGATVRSSLLTPGTTTARLTDIGDGRSISIPVTVLRQSRVTAASISGFPGGFVVTGKASHYDLGTGAYRGDLASTVQVQVFKAGRWTTVANAPTAADGSVAAAVPSAPGRFSVRLVRLAGANVTGGTSAIRMVTVPLMSARGDLGYDF